MKNKNILIITSEPRGAYHIAPLYGEMNSRSSKFTHLVPYLESLQGEPWGNLSGSLSDIHSCDRIILAGGGFTAWSESVLAYATSLAKPIYLTELAYGSFVQNPSYVHVTKVSVLTPVSKKIVHANLALSSANIIVTGSPQVLVRQAEVRGVVLLLSTSEMSARDPDLHLLRIATYLRDNNIPCLVRPHPREDRSLWACFTLSMNPLLNDDLAKAKLVIAYTGTPSLNVVASGIPLINLAPSENFINIIPKDYLPILPNWAKSEAEAIMLLANFTLPSESDVASLLGNNLNAAQNIVDFWESD